MPTDKWPYEFYERVWERAWELLNEKYGESNTRVENAVEDAMMPFQKDDLLDYQKLNPEYRKYFDKALTEMNKRYDEHFEW